MLSQSINRKGLIAYYDFSKAEDNKLIVLSGTQYETKNKSNQRVGYLYFDDSDSYLFTDYEVLNA